MDANTVLWPSWGDGDSLSDAATKTLLSRFLDISFDSPERLGGRGSETIGVVFVDEDGDPVGKMSSYFLDKTDIPASALMPKGDVKHRICFGTNGAILAVQVSLKKKKMALSDVRRIGGQIVRTLQNEEFETAAIYYEGAFSVSGRGITKKKVLQAFLHGLQTATYAMTDFKSEKKKRALKSVIIIAEPHRNSWETHEETRDLVTDIVIAEHKSRRWIDLPAQKDAMSTDDLVGYACAVAAQSDTKSDVMIKVIRGDELTRTGLNVLWSVGKGRTDSPPALVVLRYNGADQKAPTIALIGKGIVFDTGGENLKTESSIDGMHADMSGAAMALATFDLAVRRKAKVNLVATLAIADNSVSGSSYHPRSVLKSYSGKTIEVLNTDAEGRLVLADAVCYTEKHYKPDYLVTLATLTGACVIALGDEFAGLFAKSDKMAEALEEASHRTWNKVWRMPLSEAVHTKLKTSTIADVTNLGPRPGGAITAAKFILQEFAETKHAAHLDVAGVAASIMGKAVDATGEPADFSTGWGPALLWEAINILSRE